MLGRDITSIQEAQCSPQTRVGIEISLLCLPFSLNFSPLEGEKAYLGCSADSVSLVEDGKNETAASYPQKEERGLPWPHYSPRGPMWGRAAVVSMEKLVRYGFLSQLCSS